jgi:pyridoxal phosphate enzyme (YggS family)
MSTVAKNIEQINERIRQAALRAGRAPDEVRLVAVTKTLSAQRVREAYDAGQRLFGENYVQEALDKMSQLPPDATWHMIGHLQSNKAKRVVEGFAALHTLDRPSLAKALNRAAGAQGVTLEVLLQVNIGAEQSKAGATPEEAVELAKRASSWPNLAVKGIMAIPPYCPDPEEVRPYFREIKALGKQIDSLGIEGVSMGELSMGMSHDFEVAVEEGATLVRVGSAIFGERI